jgi:hypothetical protein
LTPSRVQSVFLLVLLAAHPSGAQQEPTGRDSAAFAELSVTYYDILRSTSSLQSISLTAMDYTLRGQFEYAGGKIRLGAQRLTAEFRNHDKRSTFDVALYNKLQRLSLDYSADFGNFGFDIGADVLDEFQHARLFGRGLVRMRFPFSYVDEIRVGIRESSFPVLARATYLDSELPLSHALEQTAVEASVIFSLLRGNSIGLDYVASGNQRRNDSFPFTLRDETESRSWTASVHQSFSSWNCGMEYDRRTFKSSDGFFHEGNSFGEATLFDALDESIVLNCIHRRGAAADMDIDAGFENIEGSFVGDLQAWPFLSVLQSVITNRINFRFTGSLRFWHIGLGREWDLGIVSLRPAVAYYDVRPDIVIDSWQPQYLVIGVSDFRENRLDVIRAGLGRLGLDIGIRTPWVNATLNGTQFFPVYQTRRSVQPGPGVPPSPGPEQGRATLDGGRWIRLTLRKEL